MRTRLIQTELSKSVSSPKWVRPRDEAAQLPPDGKAESVVTFDCYAETLIVEGCKPLHI